MKTQLESIQKFSHDSILGAKTSIDLDLVKSRTLGKSSDFNGLMKMLATIPKEERPEMGKLINTVKNELEILINKKQKDLLKSERESSLATQKIDSSLPGVEFPVGTKHPITQTIERITEILGRIGFDTKEGTEIETDFYNFEALNIKEDHPARDMHDTFYLNTDHVLRTHTSPAQIHEMESNSPPIKIIVPGQVFRCDSDVTHSPVFHQIEGLYVNKKVSFAELKGTLSFFINELFGTTPIRFRPSYFPFTEPSSEIDVQCVMCQGKGCNVCGHTGWLEILGAGMVNREVFKSVGYNPDEVQGFAFGVGVERIAMLMHGINDIRLFYENDRRFLEQF
ncbi:phenylalanine--tRNA ligase subunit alpha [bacterium]|nr:phenylalanine--tRNA ligase subunit alpha [bacterium]